MTPWERRLKDLSQLLRNCHSTYFEPELFRMNTNQFLQTARTVTFIIQKNKETIPNYQVWYQSAVIQGWKDDRLMTWAKDARNIIEKEGDLELNSSLNVRLIFSYFENEDLLIKLSNAELLKASIKKLIRIAQKKLPSGVSDAAIVKVERRWVTASLPEWELLHALNYIYSRLFECCASLAAQFGSDIDPSIQNLSEGETLREISRQIRYIKLNGLKSYSFYSEKIGTDKSFTPPKSLNVIMDSFHEQPVKPKTLTDSLEIYSKIAEATFEHYGNHVPMLFIFNSSWQPIDMLTMHFADQAEKYIFWRVIADRVYNLKATGLIWVSESWIRKYSRHNIDAIRNLPIIGESLNIMAIDYTGLNMEISWNIIRETDDAKPSLVRKHEGQERQKEIPNFIRPAFHALTVINS